MLAGIVVLAAWAATAPPTPLTLANAELRGSVEQRVYDYAQPCQNTSNREESDLCQQWRMAEAADRQVMLNWFSAVLLSLTLIATAAAARAAVVAATAAQKGLEQSERHKQQEIAAYVHVKKARIIWLDDLPIIKVWIANSGQTPAKYFRVGCDAVLMDSKNVRSENIPTNLTYNNWPALAGNDTLTAHLFPMQLKKNVERLVPGQNDGKPLIVWGNIFYGDIFGQEYVTEFAFFTWVAEKGKARKLSRTTAQLRVYHKLEHRGGLEVHNA